MYRTMLLALLAAALPLRAQEYSKTLRAGAATDAGVNGIGYEFAASISSSSGQSRSVGGFLALRMDAGGMLSGALADSVSGKVYTVAGASARGSLRLTFTAEDGETFSGSAPAGAGSLLPVSLGGPLAGGLGTWSASDGAYFIGVPGGVLLPPDFACNLCQLYHFCSALPQIPCTACKSVCGPPKRK
ncbi:MAG: hypothetical protein NW241_19640 [Bacteroidia bacterium]|nr:hypothetical protein [Bacteroidia bacterium]